MRTLTLACVAAATLAVSPALGGDYFPWAGYAWHPTVSWRDYYAYHYHYPIVAPDGHHWRHWHQWRRGYGGYRLRCSCRR